MVPATKLGFTAGQTTKPLAKGAGQDGLTELCAAGGCMPPEHAIIALPSVPGLISLSCGAPVCCRLDMFQGRCRGLISKFFYFPHPPADSSIA